MAIDSDVTANIIRYPSSLGNPKARLKAEGNLTYLDFIRTLEVLWYESHPDIPFYGTGLSKLPKYPAIVYSLDSRVTFQGEPKPRLREIPDTDPNGPAVLVSGQRFVNIIRFTAIDEVDPNGTQVVEELIEAFEEFMQEYLPVLKKLGASEIRYSRRLPDHEVPRSGEDVVTRAVTYSVVTERITRVSIDRLEHLLVRARTFSELNSATPDYETAVIGTTAIEFTDDFQS